MAWPCRCRRCDKRKTLARHPEDYLKPPRCPCGKSTMAIDAFRSSGRENVGKTCRCSGYHFPHHTGRGWCELAPWTADQLKERLGQ